MSLSGGSAAVNIREIDLSTYVPGFAGVYGAIILPAHKGPIDEPQLVTSEVQFLQMFSFNQKVEVGDSLAYYSALSFLQRSDKLWIKRVVGDNYKFGGMTFQKLGSASNTAWSAGLEDPTSQLFGANDVMHFYASDPGDWNNRIAVKLWLRRVRESVTLNSTNIQSAAATPATGLLGVGKTIVTPAVAATGDLDSKILISAVAGADGNFTVNLVGGGTAGSETAVKVGDVVTVTIEDGVSTQAQIRTALLTLDSSIATVVVDTAGSAWTLGVGTDTVTLSGGEDEIVEISTGEITITTVAGSASNALTVVLVDGASAAGAETIEKVDDVITVTIKDGASTQTHIRTKLLTLASSIASVTVAHGTDVWTLGASSEDTAVFTGGTDASSKITVSQQFVSGEPIRITLLDSVTGDVLPGGLDSVTTYWTVADTATSVKLALSQDDALAGITQVFSSVGQGTMQIIPLKEVKSVGAFLVEVFKVSNLLVPVESFECSMSESAKDGYGQNMFIEDVMQGSNYLRAMKNVLLSNDPRPQVIPLVINGGDDGDPVTDGKMMLGADVFSNPETYPVTCFMDGGWATPAFQKYLDTICQNRHDSVALLSVPYDLESQSNYLNAIVDYRKNILNLSSSYSALYATHVKIYDKFNDRNLYIAPDGYAGAAISFSALNYEMWYPPAGFKRGNINVLDCRRRFSRGEMDYLYDSGVNPIRFYPGKGILIWGQKTLLGYPSALDRLNVRLLLVVIEPAIKAALEPFLFDLNDQATRDQIATIIRSYLVSIQARRGIYDFMVKCDADNNTDSDIAQHRLNCDIYIKPTQSIEYINETIVIVGQSISFQLAQQLV